MNRTHTYIYIYLYTYIIYFMYNIYIYIICISLRMRVHVCVRHLPTGRERIASEFSEDLYDSIDAFLFNWNIKLFL